MPLDVRAHLPADPEAAARRCLSSTALGLVGSEILKIAADVRALAARGTRVVNLTVGDFAPSQFRIPEALATGIARALERGETNYPPSDGLPELRAAVRAHYAEALGLDYPLESVLIAGGARPLIYATYRAVLEPGDTVVYPVPSWNNNHYAFLSGARAVAVPTSPDSDFLPTAALLEPHLAGARLLCLNSPLNPTGTMLEERVLREIAELVVEENRVRERRGERALVLLYDHIYWPLTAGGRRHHTPVALVPECAPYVVFVDGLSKGFAATGLRVGWSVAPPAVTARMRDLLGHVGAWAPRPEQLSSAALLDDAPARESYLADLRAGVGARLDALHRGIEALRRQGAEVAAIAPQGGIYLSARLGSEAEPNETVRRRLLDEAGVAVVPFEAFDHRGAPGWFRLSVGAVSVADCEEAVRRIGGCLARPSAA